MRSNQGPKKRIYLSRDGEIEKRSSCEVHGGMGFRPAGGELIQLACRASQASRRGQR